MSQMKSRRELGLLAAGGVVAAGVIAGAKPAAAEQQREMERARAALNDAIQFLRAASDNKGGHKIKAMELIQNAIAEVDAGIEYADTH
jgi:hypothetical protein